MMLARLPVTTARSAFTMTMCSPFRSRLAMTDEARPRTRPDASMTVPDGGAGAGLAGRILSTGGAEGFAGAAGRAAAGRGAAGFGVRGLAGFAAGAAGAVGVGAAGLAGAGVGA